MEPNETQPSRRGLLRVAGALGLGAALPRALVASPAPTSKRYVLPPSELFGPEMLGKVMCTLTPSQTEGPYYVNTNLVRQNITESLPGLSLQLYVMVVQNGTCNPIPGAIVDVWHTTAAGLYSGIQSLGTANRTYMRGIQTTDGYGVVRFDTIWPGYYVGRTAHIHLKIRFSNQTELTSQLYFPDPWTDLVYANVPPYNTRPPRGTRNSNDGIYSAALEMPVFLFPGATPGSYVVATGLVIVIN